MLLHLMASDSGQFGKPLRAIALLLRRDVTADDSSILVDRDNQLNICRIGNALWELTDRNGEVRRIGGLKRRFRAAAPRLPKLRAFGEQRKLVSHRPIQPA